MQIEGSLQQTSVAVSPNFESGALKRTALLVQFAYIIIASIIVTWIVGFPGITSVFVIASVVALWKTRQTGVVIDLSLLALMLICYNNLRTAAHKFSPFQIHVADLASAERTVCFGVIPSAWLQAHIHSSGLVWLCHFSYAAHFVYPVLLALALWYKHKNLYWPYVTGLMVLTYSGFICYLLAPTAPPWWASHFGAIPERIIVSEVPISAMLAGPNPVAAFPSLHGAYSAYFVMICFWVCGKRAWPSLLVPLAIAFATVYLGHHYVVDILGGYALALLGFGVAVTMNRLSGAKQRSTFAVADAQLENGRLGEPPTIG